MVRFANDCLMRIKEVVQRLEVTLGPDTADLGMRFGVSGTLHLVHNVTQQVFCNSHSAVFENSHSYTVALSQRVYCEERNQDSNSLGTLSIQPHVSNQQVCETKSIFPLKRLNY